MSSGDWRNGMTLSGFGLCQFCPDEQYPLGSLSPGLGMDVQALPVPLGITYEVCIAQSVSMAGRFRVLTDDLAFYSTSLPGWLGSGNIYALNAWYRLMILFVASSTRVSISVSPKLGALGRG